jgi:hypothetical protein
MSDIPRAPTEGELSEHLRSFFSFERLVLFAVLHIALTLSAAALAFIGHSSGAGAEPVARWLAGAALGVRTIRRLVSPRLAWSNAGTILVRPEPLP